MKKFNSENQPERKYFWKVLICMGWTGFGCLCRGSIEIITNFVIKISHKQLNKQGNFLLGSDVTTWNCYLFQTKIVFLKTTIFIAIVSNHSEQMLQNILQLFK